VSAELTCPFCEARDVERIAQWGGQMITSQWRCGACGSYFEALRDEFEDSSSAAPAANGEPPGGR
jgi:sarcosine oxidase delta subunit